MTDLQYQSGFGNQFATEAVEGTLPPGRNSPQRVARGLYAEQLSGTAFTAPRAENRRTWLYRRQPSVVTGSHAPYEQPFVKTGARYVSTGTDLAFLLAEATRRAKQVRDIAI